MLVRASEAYHTVVRPSKASFVIILDQEYVLFVDAVAVLAQTDLVFRIVALKHGLTVLELDCLRQHVCITRILARGYVILLSDVAI